MELGRNGDVMGAGSLLTWELDCRWGKEKAEDKGLMERVK